MHIYLNKRDFVEITTFRGPEDQDPTKSDNYGTPEEDAKRRDLTINALFYDPFTGELLDYVGGFEDLKKRIIRVIGIPELRYRQDPVRMMRVIRHAARTGFEIDRETWKALLRSKELIKSVSRERLRDEILKDLLGFWLMPTFERKELLKLFWALFFTFRYSRGLFEKTMDMLRDLYKMLYLKLKGKEFPKRFKRKIYYLEIVPLFEILYNVIQMKGR